LSWQTRKIWTGEISGTSPRGALVSKTSSDFWHPVATSIGGFIVELSVRRDKPARWL
jgi:hypothetical protein